MASIKSLKDTDILISCPVCLERYDDPRILPECGHQFCLTCLEKLDKQKSGFRNKRFGLICPSCRAVTKFEDESGITNLPKPVLMNEVQGILQDFLENKSAANLLCDICETSNVKATMFCEDCQDKMCDACFKEHEDAPPMSDHVSVPACVDLFCAEHDKILNHYCKTCELGVCRICTRKQHKSHCIGMIDEAAATIRLKLEHFVLIENKRKPTDEEISKLASIESDMVQKYVTAVGKIEHGISTCDKLATKLRDARAHAMEERNAIVSRLSDYTDKLEEMSEDCESNLSRAAYLIEDASDQELLAKSVDLLDAVSDCAPQSPGVHTPEVTEEFADVMVRAEKLLSSTAARYQRQLLPSDGTPANPPRGAGFSTQKGRVITDPLSVASVSTTSFGEFSAIWDILVIDNSQIVLRTNSLTGPIKVYNPMFKAMHCLGKGYPSLSKFGHLAYDTKRQLFLATMPRGIYCVPALGCKPREITFGKSKPCKLHAVAYLESHDVYLVSNIHPSSRGTYMLDPRSNSVIRHLETSAEVTSICTYTDASNNDVIVTCDRDLHQVSLFDVRGMKTRVLGKGHGQGTGELCHPSYVTTSSHGQLLVCDSGNNRLVTFNDDPVGQFYSDCVIDSSQILLNSNSVDPMKVAVNAERNMLLLSTGNTVEHYRYKK